jgi:hypothetical protein
VKPFAAISKGPNLNGADPFDFKSESVCAAAAKVSSGHSPNGFEERRLHPSHERGELTVEYGERLYPKREICIE